MELFYVFRPPQALSAFPVCHCATGYLTGSFLSAFYVSSHATGLYPLSLSLWPYSALRTRHPKSIGEESYAPPLGHAFPQAPRPALSFRLLLPTARALSRAAPRTFLRAAFRPRTRHPESIGEGSFASPLGRAFLIPRGSHLSPPSAVRPQSNTPVSGLFTMGFCRSKRDSISTFAPASLLRAKAVITSNTWYVCL